MTEEVFNLTERSNTVSKKELKKKLKAADVSVKTIVYLDENASYTIQQEKENMYGAIMKVEGDTFPIKDIESNFDLQVVESALMKHAQNIGAVPMAVQSLADGKKTALQGVEITTNDFLVLSDKTIAEKSRQYFSLVEELDTLEKEKKTEIDNLKNHYSGMLNVTQKVMDGLKPLIMTGQELTECQASWERDTSAEKMILVRIDNLKPLQMREMSAEELNPQVFDATPPAEEPKEETESTPKEE